MMRKDEAVTQTTMQARPSLEEELHEALESMRPSVGASRAWVGLFALIVLAVGLVVGVTVGGLIGGGGGGGRSSSAGGEAGAETASAEESPTQYTCGMHPEIVQDEPGFCPICGMKLTPLKTKKSGQTRKKKVQGEQACRDREVLYYVAPMDPNYTSPEPGKSPMGMDLVPVCESDVEEAVGGIYVDSRIRQNMGIQTVAVERGPLVKTIRTVGNVDYDERRLAVITSKVDGWIEELAVDFTGQRVAAGDPLFAIYSPELVSAQEELIAAAGRASGTDRAVYEAARRRLSYWDISEATIDAIEARGEATRTLPIEAPIDGYVTHKNVVAGTRVKAGRDLFRIANLDKVWVFVELYEQDVPFVRLGAEVTVDLGYDAGPPLTGKVDYIFPWLDKKTRTVRARLAFDNPDLRLKPGMYVTVNLHAKLADSAILADSSAILRSGVRNVAFVETEPGTFMPRDVKLGRDLGDTIEVMSGLDVGDKVVINGQFMLDSEARLNEALHKFGPGDSEDGGAEPAADPSAEQGGDGAEHAGHEHGAQASPAALLDARAAEGCSYTCPMPEHFDVCGTGPGKCPKCGMDLAPISELRAGLKGDAE